MEQHCLDPGSLQGPRILSQALLDECHERSELFLRIVSEGVAQLRGRVRDANYCVLLTDAQRRAIDYCVESTIRNDYRKAGLRLGTCQSGGEEDACGMAVVLANRTAVTVHKRDHFRAALIDLTCSTAPVFDPQGELLGVLDVSAVQSPDDRRSQHLIRQMVAQNARRVGNVLFMHSTQGHWVLHAYYAPGYVDSQPDYLFAWDADGRLLALNPAARYYLRQRLGQVPSHIGEVFNLDVLHAVADQMPCLLRDQAGELRVHLNTPRVEVRRLERGVSDNIALDPCIAENLYLVVRVKDRNLPVLVQGEADTGKEVFARRLHQINARRDKPFVILNCATIPESLIESRLFDCISGAFTGAAARGMRGLLQQVDGDTLFLDEIGDMPLGLQTRLLRVLAEGEVAPLGAARRQAADIRVICAIRRDLAALIVVGGFREDLYFRLGGAYLELPSLRERSGQLVLIRHILDKETAHCGVHTELGGTVLECLLGYRWPGNVHQSRHMLRYACTLCGGATLQLADLPTGLRGGDWTPASTYENGGSSKRDVLLDALMRHHWKPMAAARGLGISRTTPYRQVRRHGIRTPGQADD